MNRRDEAASIVGEELADALEKEVRSSMALGLNGYVIPTIYSVVPDTELEILQPNKFPAAFECEYCGTAYVVDLISREIDCPGCSHPPPYDQLAAALSPPLFRDTATEPVEYEGMITGSAQAYASWQGLNHIVERCRIDCKAPAVGDSGLCKAHGGGSSVYGHPITHENREAIRGAHPEAKAFFDGLILGDQPRLKTWRNQNV